METWIYFVLASQIVWSFCSLIDKFVISKGHIKNPLVYIVLNGLMGIFTIFLLPFFHFKAISFANFIAALISSAAISAAIALYYKAVQYEEISRIVMLVQFIPIFTLILSFFMLGERLSGNDFIGFILLAFAVLLVSYHKDKKSFKIGKAFYLMIASDFLVAVAYISAKQVFLATDAWNGVLWMRSTQFIAVAVLIVPSVRTDFIKTFRKMPKKIKGLLGFKAFIDFSGFMMSDFAIFLGPVSLVSALSGSIAPAITFIFALAASVYLPRFIKEETGTQAVITKIIAIALIIAGIAFINF